MLKFDPKRAAWPATLSWNASKLLKSFLAADTLSSCTVDIKVAPGSAQPDPNPSAMLVAGGATVINSNAVELDGKTVPPGHVATFKLINGVIGATYRLTFNPTYTNLGVGEGEQMDIDVVDDLPPEVS